VLQLKLLAFLILALVSYDALKVQMGSVLRDESHLCQAEQASACSEEQMYFNVPFESQMNPLLNQGRLFLYKYS